MGCVSGKPGSHTKKPVMNEEPLNKKTTNLNNLQENPELGKEPKPIVQKQTPALDNQSTQNPKLPQIQIPKPSIEEPQQNPMIIKRQVQKTNQIQQSQVNKIKGEPEIEIKQEPVPPIKTPIKDIEGSPDKKREHLSAIRQKSDQFGELKKPKLENIESLIVEQKKEEVKNSGRDSIGMSIPDMQEGFLVSKITKNNQSADKIQNQPSNLKTQLQKSPQKMVENQDIRPQEIKISLLNNQEDNQENVIINSSAISSMTDEFVALNEEQFDLNCEFDPNNLVVDMNKVAW